MRRHRIIACVLVTVACALAGGTLLLTNNAKAQKAAAAAPPVVQPLGAVAGPLPAPVMPPDIIKLEPVEKLGKFMLYDHTLSNPSGYACATCHVPTAGFTGPSSIVNLIAGTMPGVVPGRFSNRKPPELRVCRVLPPGTGL